MHVITHLLIFKENGMVVYDISFMNAYIFIVFDSDTDFDEESDSLTALLQNVTR